MSFPTAKNKRLIKPKKTNLLLSADAVARLHTLKTNHGMSRTHAIERGVQLLAQSLASGGAR